MMRCLIVVNALTDLVPKLTTYVLMAGAVKRGHEMWACAVSDFVIQTNGRIDAHAHRITPNLLGSPNDVQHWVDTHDAQIVCVDELDVWLLRTNPARASRSSMGHTLSWIACRAQQQGVVVLNDPISMSAAGNKLYPTQLPHELVPRTLVSNNPTLILSHVREWGGPVVLKPVHGTRGQNVFLVRYPNDPNLRQMLDVILQNDYAVVQEYLTDEEEGDLRMIFVGGELLTAQGQPSIVSRIPATGDFRANLNAGGTIKGAALTPRTSKLANTVGAVLVRDNIFLAAVDSIDGKVLELNVFSPGGWEDAEAVYHIDFNTVVLDAVEAEVARTRGSQSRSMMISDS